MAASRETQEETKQAAKEKTASASWAQLEEHVDEHNEGSMMSDEQERERIARGLKEMLANEPPRGGRRQTKGEQICEHRKLIVALRAKGWTWDAIAEKLTALGLAVTGRTVRVALRATKAKTKRTKAAKAPA